MNALLLICLASTILTIFTLVESVIDYRAVLRQRAEKPLVRDSALHGVLVEVLRVMKVLVLTVGGVVATYRPDDWMLRASIIATVAAAIGLTSLAELAFRRRTMGILKAEYLASKDAVK